MDKVREEFEKEYLASMNPQFFENEEPKKVYLKTDNNGNYVHDCTRLAYLCFVKDRETVVVQLLKKRNEKQCLFDFQQAYWQGYNLSIYDITNKLDNVGVKYE